MRWWGRLTPGSSQPTVPLSRSNWAGAGSETPHLERDQSSRQQRKGRGCPGWYKDSTSGQTQSRPQPPLPPPMQLNQVMGSALFFLHADTWLRCCGFNRPAPLTGCRISSSRTEKRRVQTWGRLSYPLTLCSHFQGREKRVTGTGKHSRREGFTLVETALQSVSWLPMKVRLLGE